MNFIVVEPSVETIPDDIRAAFIALLGPDGGIARWIIKLSSGVTITGYTKDKITKPRIQPIFEPMCMFGPRINHILQSHMTWLERNIHIPTSSASQIIQIEYWLNSEGTGHPIYKLRANPQAINYYELKGNGTGGGVIYWQETAFV